MKCEARLSVKFDAFSVGMRAQVNDLNQTDIDALIAKSEQLLGSDDILARAITGFATQLQLNPRDPDWLKQQGRALTDFIATLSIPVPPDQGRKDIYG